MKKRKLKKPSPKPKQDQAWFERKVAEMATELEKLPADRQEQFDRELERDAGSAHRSGPAKLE